LQVRRSRTRVSANAGVLPAFAFLALLSTSVCAEQTVPADPLARERGTRVIRIVGEAQDYARNCQGCHGHKGVSVPEVPALKDRVGYFVHTEEGRRYIVQVPGVATNVLDDKRLAAVLNWILRTYSSKQLPASFKPYTAQEVGELRKHPLKQTIPVRESVVQGLLAAGVVSDPALIAYRAFAKVP
jgi:mono/diheme cytochrome c family protein